jgi:hypothetical protein
MENSCDGESDGSDRMSDKGVYTCNFGLTRLPADQLVPMTIVRKSYPVASVSLMTAMTDG